MRTTIDLPDGLFRKVKAVSSLKGMSLKEYLTRAIEHEVESAGVKFESRRIKHPLVPSRHPGSIAIDAAGIAEILDREDGHVSA